MPRKILPGFNDPDSDEQEIVEVKERTGYVWHCNVPGLPIGQLYGYRVHGPYEPAKGLRFNPAKLVIDPYAKALTGGVNWDSPVFGYRIGSAEQDLSCDPNDDASGVPKGIVTTSHFDWQNDRGPGTPLHESVIYEAHIKG